MQRFKDSSINRFNTILTKQSYTLSKMVLAMNNPARIDRILVIILHGI
ncbi:MAG: hypothetical protein RR409_17815 [Clostridium sp.]